MVEDLGLVKTIFRQDSAPTSVDALWYDIEDAMLKYCESTSVRWRPLKQIQLSGSLTPNMPTAAELNNVIGQTASEAGIGLKVTIRNINDSTLYLVESDGEDWYYKKLSKIELVTDYDDNAYHVVQIGNQLWMVENLKTTHYRDGTPIPNITNNNDWAADTIGAYCWYNNDITNKQDYGALYNWYAVNNAHGLAPEGWRVATYNDFNNLGDQYTVAGKMKEVGLIHWDSPNTGATDEFGLKMVGSSYRYNDGTFYSYLKKMCLLWELNEYNIDNAYMRTLLYNSAELFRAYYPKKYGMTVRCVRDV